MLLLIFFSSAHLLLGILWLAPICLPYLGITSMENRCYQQDKQNFAINISLPFPSLRMDYSSLDGHFFYNQVSPLPGTKDLFTTDSESSGHLLHSNVLYGLCAIQLLIFLFLYYRLFLLSCMLMKLV